MGVVGVVAEKAPDLLNLLVGRGTNTALLGERVWELSQVALQCGEETVGLLRRGERDLDDYRVIPEAAPLLEAIDGFLHTYGHRAFRYASEFESTRLADQPEMVLLTIGGLLEGTESPALRSEAARQASEQALLKRGPLRRWLWRVLLRWGSGLVERREEIREVMELQNATYGLAARLLSRHYFPGQPQDHLWLYTIDEFLAFGQSDGQKRVAPEVIAERRASLARYRRQGMLPEMIWYDPGEGEWWAVEGAETREQESLPGDCLQGIAASAGSGPVEGFALVTSSPEEAAERLLSITGPVVLVTEVTDPVWSSLFRRVTAVVTEMGGVVSHPAIVARENGIPAVVGLAGATHQIKDGEWVRVDGASGTVKVLGMTAVG
jgi:phosphohistidine swiveling domain-containing protein